MLNLFEISINEKATVDVYLQRMDASADNISVSVREMDDSIVVSVMDNNDDYRFVPTVCVCKTSDEVAVYVDGTKMESFTSNKEAEWFIKYGLKEGHILSRTYTNMFNRLDKIFDKKDEDFFSFLED